MASSRWASEIVVVVTRQPRVVAAWMAKPPQPLPISSTWSPGPRPSFVQIRSSLASCASRSDMPGRSKTAHEYVSVSSRNSS